MGRASDFGGAKEESLELQDYRSIKSSIALGLGTISGIIHDARREMPDLDQLRQLNQLLKREDVSIKEAKDGARLIANLTELRISVERAKQAIAQIAGYGAEAPEILVEAEELGKIEQGTGIKYTEIASDFRRKAEAIPKLSDERDGLRQQLDELYDSIRDAKGLKELNDKLDEHNIPPKKLDRFIDANNELDGRGFTPKVAEILSAELLKHGLIPAKAARILADALKKEQSLEKSYIAKKGELKAAEIKIEKIKLDIEMRQTILVAQEEQFQATKGALKELDTQRQAKFSRIDSEAGTREEELNLKHLKRKSELEQKEQFITKGIQGLESKKGNLEERIKTLTVEVKDLEKEKETHGKIRTEIDAIKKEILPLDDLSNLSHLISEERLFLSGKDLEVVMVLLNNLEKDFSLSRRYDPSTLETLRAFKQRLFVESRTDL